MAKNKPNFKNYDCIGEYLRDVREYLQGKHGRQKYSQNAVAKKLGLVGQNISNFERGLVLPPSRVAVKLIKFYGIEREAMYHLFLMHRERELRKVFLAKKTK